MELKDVKWKCYHSRDEFIAPSLKIKVIFRNINCVSFFPFGEINHLTEFLPIIDIIWNMRELWN